MIFSKSKQGRQAEKAACTYLEKYGLKLVTNNYRCRYGEIDLIMWDKDDIVFVEVRSHSMIDYGSASESITPSKIQKLLKTAQTFLQAKRLFEIVSTRFDVIAIDVINNQINYEWIKNAFQMEE